MRNFSIQIIVLGILLLMSTAAVGQLLNNQLGEAFTDRPFFNSTIISQNNIKSIRGNFTHYKHGDAFRETKLYRAYHFNEDGRLIKQLESRKTNHGIDTLVSFYEYDQDGNLTALRQKDEYGFYAYIYKYDSAGRVIREEYRRNLTRGKQKATEFKLGKEFIVTFETASYQEFDGQLKKTVYNSYGVPYKDVISYFNEDGQIIEKVERLRRTSGGTKTIYSYNGKGLLDTLETTSNISGNQNRLYVFKYDEYNNLEEKKYFKNGVLTTIHNVIYDSETMVIDNILIKNVATNFIRILRLEEYNFYNVEEE